jgi:hypothetical protein
VNRVLINLRITFPFPARRIVQPNSAIAEC